MRACVACLALFLACAVPCAAQQQPFRVFVNVGLQATSTTVSEQQSFDQYFEQGSFTLERPLPKSFFYDVGGTARLWRELHAGLAVSIFDNRGSGAVTARVPHPLLFNQPRTTTGDVDDIKRREIGQHITIGWRILVSPDLDFMVFGGPSVFTTEQTFLTALALSLDKEVFPFDTLPFPGAQTETQRENSVGYNTRRRHDVASDAPRRGRRARAVRRRTNELYADGRAGCRGWSWRAAPWWRPAPEVLTRAGSRV